MQEPTIEIITDPLFGEEGKIYGKDDRPTAIFYKEFPPAKRRIMLQVWAIDKQVPQTERDLYQEIETWYPQGVQVIFKDILHQIKMKTYGGDYILLGLRDVGLGNIADLEEGAAVEKIAGQLELLALDLRYSSNPPAKCILFFRYAPGEPCWYAALTEDYQIRNSGVAD